MLSNMLNRSGSFYIKIILVALLVVSFGIWGIADFLTSTTVNNIATVGETEIKSVAYQREFNNRIERAENRRGRPYTIADLEDSTIPERALDKLTGDAALVETARVMGLGISDSQLAKILQKDETFRGPTGTFDEVALTQSLKRAGTTERRFFEQRRKQAEIELIDDAITGPMNYLKIFYDAAAVFRTQERKLRFVVIPPDAIGEPDDPTEDDLIEYHEENTAEFNIPEYRKIEYFSLNVEDFIEIDTVSDEEVMEEYEANKSDEIIPEKREISILTFLENEAVSNAKSKIDEGATFTEILTENNIPNREAYAGYLSRDEIEDPKVASAAFKLEINEVSKIINGEYGKVIIEVSDIIPEKQIPFEDVKEKYKNILAMQQAEDDLQQLFEQIEDARDGADTLSELAEISDSEIMTSVLVSKRGINEDGENIEFPLQKDLLKSVFASEVNSLPEPISSERTNFVWFSVVEIVDEVEREYDEVKELVKEEWNTRRKQIIPFEGELEEYFVENKEEFEIPEYRVVEYLELNPEDLKRPEEITDEEAMEKYEESTSNDHITPERRLISQIIFEDMESAEDAKKKLDDGTTFNDLLAELEIESSDANLGFKEQGEILDEHVDEVAFAMEEKGISEIIEGRFGPVIIEVGDILPESRQPFEDIKEEYKETLAGERASELVDELYEKVEDARAAGDSFEEIADLFDLTVRTTVPVSKDGNDVDGEYVNIPEQYTVLREAFKSDINIENDPVPVRDTGYIWYTVLDIIPEIEPELDDVYEDVVEAWEKTIKKKFQEKLAEKIQKRMEDGEILELIAAPLDLHGKTTPMMTRRDTDAGLPRPAIETAFSAPEGEFKIGDGDEDDVVLIQILKVENPPPPEEDDEEITKLKDEIADTLQQGLQEQYRVAAAEYFGISLNRPIYRAIIEYDRERE